MRAAALLLAALALAGCLGGEPLPNPPLGDPACPEGPGFRQFEDAAVREASGLARSGRVPCLLWALNDSGHPPWLFATDARGRRLGTVEVDARNTDWEDLASFELDGVPHLAIADTGNNARARGTVQVLVLPEPATNATGALPARAGAVRTIELRYPEAPFDAEGLAVDPAADELLLVSKGSDQALYTAPFAAALRDGRADLTRRAVPEGLEPLHASVGLGPAREAVTAMDLHPERRALALLTYDGAYVWARVEGQTWAEAVQALPQEVRLPEGARYAEALAYSGDGRWLLVGDEQGAPNSRIAALPAP